MKCLSVKQPWASLIVLGAKVFETRTWRTPHRGTLAIHASQNFSEAQRVLCTREPFHSTLLRAGYRQPSDLPRGFVLGTIEVVDCLSTEQARERLMDNARQLAFGDYRPGRFAWKLEGATQLLVPVRQAGRLRLFDVSDLSDMRLSS